MTYLEIPYQLGTITHKGTHIEYIDRYNRRAIYVSDIERFKREYEALTGNTLHYEPAYDILYFYRIQITKPKQITN